MTWFLFLFAEHRDLQQERDDALRDAGYCRAQAEKWEARCEKAREELMDTLRGNHEQPAVEPPAPNTESSTLKPSGAVQGRVLQRIREKRFWKAQKDKFEAMN